jgi:hypothetical protein
LLHRWTMGIQGFTRLITAWTWGKPPPSPYSIFCDCPWGLHLNVNFLGTPKLGVPKFLKLGLTSLWRPITSYKDLWLRQGVKQSCSPSQKLSNIMLHVTCTHIIQGDSWVLVVRIQIDTFTPNPSFGQNLCCKYSNE